jgi:hypothetical protein
LISREDHSYFPLASIVEEVDLSIAAAWEILWRLNSFVRLCSLGQAEFSLEGPKYTLAKANLLCGGQIPLGKVVFFSRSHDLLQGSCILFVSCFPCGGHIFSREVMSLERLNF